VKPQNNPGNIENGPFAQSIPGYQPSNGRFANFASPEAGAAAEDKLLASYGQRGVSTPLAIASRWAPAGDGKNNPQAYGAFIAQQLGVDPNAQIDLTNPQIRQRVAQAISRFEGNGASTAPQGQPMPQGQSQQTQQGQPQVVPQPNAAPTMSEGTAARYEQAANVAYQKAQAASLVDPSMSAAFKAQGDAYMKQASIIRETLGKNSQLTPAQKDAGSSGSANPLDYEKNKKIQEGNITSGQKEYEGIQAQSTQYERDLKPYLDVSKSIINDPKFYSGIGGELSLDFNRVKAALGDKNAAVLQEALSKVTASSVLAQINNQRAQIQEAGGTSSRIFRQQVDLVEKAAPSLANTPAGNRFLVEVSSRMGDLSSHVAQMARDYKQQHGYLDSGFDQQLSSYMKNNPVFTSQEMTHPEILGAPTVPQQYASSVNSVQSWARAMGVKPGEAIRFPNGSVKAMQYSSPQAAQ
jgi:hypothetical protein